MPWYDDVKAEVIFFSFFFCRPPRKGLARRGEYVWIWVGAQFCNQMLDCKAHLSVDFMVVSYEAFVDRACMVVSRKMYDDKGGKNLLLNFLLNWPRTFERSPFAFHCH